ncbi:hypothetical protein A0130_06230 [Leifsonia xyli]|nr:hypothetical protein A0130_06230 [Leifsonia xyli]
MPRVIRFDVNEFRLRALHLAGSRRVGDDDTFVAHGSSSFDLILGTARLKSHGHYHRAVLRTHGTQNSG